jgi:hypothetical protein
MTVSLYCLIVLQFALQRGQSGQSQIVQNLAKQSLRLYNLYFGLIEIFFNHLFASVAVETFHTKRMGEKCSESEQFGTKRGCPARGE